MTAHLMIKNEAAKATYYHGTIPQYYENNSKDMLSIYLPCPSLIPLSMEGLTLSLNTLDNDVRKV